MKLLKLSAIAALLFSATSAFSQLKNEADSASYSIGLNLGNQFKSQGLTELNPDVLAMAIKDVLNGTPLIDVNLSSQIIQNYIQNQNKTKYSKNIATSAKFLEENKKRKGVITTASGLQYEVITAGTGEKPTTNDKVKVHYHGTLIDGTVFDSSVQRGEAIEFGVTQVIKGWTEALQLMPVGSKWKLFIPENLAYGANPRPGGAIEPYMALIFEVELIAISK